MPLHYCKVTALRRGNYAIIEVTRIASGNAAVRWVAVAAAAAGDLRLSVGYERANSVVHTRTKSRHQTLGLFCATNANR